MLMPDSSCLVWVDDLLLWCKVLINFIRIHVARWLVMKLDFNRSSFTQQECLRTKYLKQIKISTSQFQDCPFDHLFQDWPSPPRFLIRDILGQDYKTKRTPCMHVYLTNPWRWKCRGRCDVVFTFDNELIV